MGEIRPIATVEETKTSPVTSNSSYEYIKVFIDNSLHLAFDSNELLAMQSWIETESIFCIELTFKGGTSITNTYYSKDIWVAVLAELNERI